MALFFVCLAAIGVVASGETGAAGSVLYDAATHVPRASAGCGKPSPYRAGVTSVATGTYAGVKWTYRIYVPKSYSNKEPMPLILQHPGWGMDARSEESGAGITLFAEKRGFISVTPQGGSDNPNWGGPWYSWNAVGTSQSPGPAGPTCTQKANHPDYCYTSCNKCSDKPQCDWTTCEETVTPTGTGKKQVGGFIPGLYDTLEEQLCIDTTREFAAGESNGGMMTYQLGVDLSQRLAAIAPQFGSFHRGFLEAPSVGVPVLDIHGKSDHTVPANVSLSADGYYYTPTDEIFGGNAYSSGWKHANDCTGPSTHYVTNYDGIKELWCVSEGKCSGGDVVRCSYKGGHNWFDGGGSNNGGLVTDFLLNWKKSSHIGRGYSLGEELGSPQLLENITVIAAGDETLAVEGTNVLQAGGHYGDPARGCLPDEDTIPLGSGITCSPRIGVESQAVGMDEPPTPTCNIGGVAPSDNGCPVDANVDSSSKAWPICLARGMSSDPYMKAEFHCMLVCPCPGSSEECGPEADAHCPDNARCVRGELRYRVQGVCAYHTDRTADVVVV